MHRQTEPFLDSRRSAALPSIPLGGAAGLGEHSFLSRPPLPSGWPAETLRRPGLGMAVLAKTDAVFVGVVLRINSKRSRGGGEENMVN
ncbi:MAG: hypothetical protein EOM70_12690 [Clostridia bacterium]|nr:hypothetical protein [Clostridia bacterium]